MKRTELNSGERRILSQTPKMQKVMFKNKYRRQPHDARSNLEPNVNVDEILYILAPKNIHTAARYS